MVVKADADIDRRHSATNQKLVMCVGGKTTSLFDHEGHKESYNIVLIKLNLVQQWIYQLNDHLVCSETNTCSTSTTGLLRHASSWTSMLLLLPSFYLTFCVGIGAFHAIPSILERLWQKGNSLGRNVIEWILEEKICQKWSFKIKFTFRPTKKSHSSGSLRPTTFLSWKQTTHNDRNWS